MHELDAFLRRRPLIGASLQKAMAEDFINKVYQSRGHEERYRLLLVESLDPGSINPIGREKLRRYKGGVLLLRLSFPTQALVCVLFSWRGPRFVYSHDSVALCFIGWHRLRFVYFSQQLLRCVIVVGINPR